MVHENNPPNNPSNNPSNSPSVEPSPAENEFRDALSKAQALRASKAHSVETEAYAELRALLVKHNCRIEPVLTFGPQITTTIRLVWEG